MKAQRWALLAAAALCACGSELASPFQAVAITFDVTKQTYKIASVPVRTLSSLRRLEGSATVVTSGGSVRVRRAAIKAKGATVSQLRTAFITEPASPVQLTWTVLNDIVYPEDFESLELLSAYYNLEKGRAFISSATPTGGAPLLAKPMIAHARLVDDDGLRPLPDGELYYAPLGGFYLPEITAADQLPATFNLGAVAHALGHEAVEERVWAGAPSPLPEQGPDKDPDWNSARHLARSFVEGVADFLGVAASGDPLWFNHSRVQGAATRTLDQIHCGSPDMLDALPAIETDAPYNPYPLGSVLAGALWEASAPQDPSKLLVVAKGVLAALPTLGQKAAAAQGKLSLGTFLDALVANAAPEIQPDLCGLFVNRFAQLSVKSGDLPSCAQVAPTAHAECQ